MFGIQAILDTIVAAVNSLTRDREDLGTDTGNSGKWFWLNMCKG